MTTTLKKIALNILSVLIFISVPTTIALFAIGDKINGQLSFYIMIGIAIPYYLINEKS